MCGIVGVVVSRGGTLRVGARDVARMRDAMAHRGPDGAGLWEGDGAILGHRRLAVIDPTPGGDQPMATPDGRFVLTYNGELYNDGELRGELSRLGAVFRSRSDSETVLHALAAWGPDSLSRLRGMFALALLDTRDRTLLLARDPLGIKPLYTREVGGQLAFASEIGALLAMPDAAPRPDLTVVSAYMTTIRTVLGERTLYEGVRTLRPGQATLWDLGADVPRRSDLGVAVRPREPRGEEPAGGVRRTVEDSVRRHLRSDVPICALLSGGLDSSIIASVARERIGGLHTYCSGAPEAEPGGSEDFAFARDAAEALGTIHTEVPISRELFGERWAEMVGATGVPLGTPNEVAINEVARRMRADGRVVTLSGEGADELFGGYDAPLVAAMRYEESRAGRASAGDRGRFQLESNAWIAATLKGQMLSPEVWTRLEQDAALVLFYEEEFAAAAEGEGDALQAHLRFHRRINLAGLLQRLDSAAMLTGVEGRTPFADVDVAALAESLPMDAKFGVEGGGEAYTKRALREAFCTCLPAAIVARSKASFPLPFQQWMGDQAVEITRSPFLRGLVRPAAIAAVAARPGELWNLAWPLINLALWGRRWD